MAMVVKNNLAAVRTLNVLNSNSSALNKSLARVSSGMKITGAQDDAAGYAISERMRVRIRALDQANQNTQNDSSLMKTAEGAVGNTVEILRALKEKAINAANDANTDEDRQTIQKEINQFIDQIDDNALVTFNGKYLIDGSKNNAAVETKTILLNQSLQAGTLAGDKLTTYANRAGDSLGIQSTDYYQVSWVQNGEIHTTSGQVGANTLEGILSAAKLDGTVAATGTDGLIGISEAGNGYLDGYADTNMTKVYNATGLDATDVAKMFTDVTLGTLPSNASDDGATISFTGYSTVALDESGEATDTPKDVTVTITAVSDSSYSGLKFDVAIAGSDEATAATDADSAIALYRKESLSTSYATSDGTPKTSDGYIDAPTDASAKFTDDELGTNPLAGAFTVPTGSANAINLGDQGYYTATKDADGVVTSYTKVDVKFYYDNGDSKFHIVDGNTSGAAAALVGQDLYKLADIDPASNTALTQVVVTGTDSTATNYVDLPDTITVEKEPDPNAEVVKDVPDKYNKDVYTPDKTEGVAVVANNAGVKNQISGLTISILDQDHNVKKAANAALDQFKQYQRAENQTGDMSLNFHIGSEANQAIKVGMGDMRAEALGLKGSDGTRIDVFTKDRANASINVIENALTKALDQQTTIGAIEARLEYTSTNLTTSSENVQAAESTIRDADMAKEMTNYTKANVLLQAAQAMLAQANQSSSGVLSLLQ